jgi:trigger factor
MPEEEGTVQPETPVQTAEETAPEPTDEAPAQGEQAQEDPYPKPEVAVEDVGTARKKVRITIPEERVQGRLNDRYQELSDEVQIPGFRRGRAPRRLIEKRLGEEVAEETKLKLLSDAMEQATEEFGFRTIGEPDLDLESVKLPESGALQFEFEVDVRPEFELPDLDNIVLRVPKTEITDEAVEGGLQRLLRREGTWEPVEEGEVEAEDAISADATLTVEGATVETERALTLIVRPDYVLNVFVRNLPDMLAGATVDETRSTEVTLPVAYPEESLRGRDGKIDITVRAIRRLRPAELNEAFVQSFGLEKPEDVYEVVRNTLERSLERRVRQTLHQQMRGYLVEHTSLDLPEKLTQDQSRRVLERQRIAMRRHGMEPGEIAQRLGELEQTSSREAVAELKLYFILGKAAEALEIEVEEEDINTAIYQLAMAEERRPEQVRSILQSQGRMPLLAAQVRDEKVLDTLVARAKVEEVEPQAAAPPPAKEQAKPEADQPEKGEGEPEETQEEAGTSTP